MADIKWQLLVVRFRLSEMTQRSNLQIPTGIVVLGTVQMTNTSQNVDLVLMVHRGVVSIATKKGRHIIHSVSLRAVSVSWPLICLKA